MASQPTAVMTQPDPPGGAPPPEPDRSRPNQLSWWLFIVAGIILVMIVVGGATRLTQSGLSITTWDPVSGAIPPLSQADWEVEFANYQDSPQYERVNNQMTLSEFKPIFWWEWAHRLIGRIIGIAIVVPFVWFLVRRRIPPGYGWRIVGLAALLALQGVIGWWMVASGLVDRPSVAHERLAIHLFAALVLFAAVLWTALDLHALGRHRTRVEGRPRRWIWPFMVILFIQFMLGAFTAGLQGGFVDNTWPLMDGTFMPASTRDMSPWWTNAVHNPMGVQFLHRWWAVVVAFTALWVAWQLYRAGARRIAFALETVVVVQFVLGVFTLVLRVPTPLAVIHQGVGTLVLAAALVAAHWSVGGARRTDSARLAASHATGDPADIVATGATPARG